jgi:hypothetical protein
MVNVTAPLNDEVKGRDSMGDAVDHAPDPAKRKEEADRSAEETAAGSVRDAIVQ